MSQSLLSAQNANSRSVFSSHCEASSSESPRVSALIRQFRVKPGPTEFRTILSIAPRPRGPPPAYKSRDRSRNSSRLLVMSSAGDFELEYHAETLGFVRLAP